MEEQKRKCKSCGQDKILIYYKLGTNGSTLYKDGDGKLWKGQVCNECQSKRRSEQRNKVKVELKTEKDS